MKNSEIAWTDHTFNPWIGCTKVSPGCANCYAENETYARVQRSKGVELWGKGNPRHRTSEAYWRQPLAWNKEAAYKEIDHTDELALGKDLGIYQRPRVFCGSMCDWLDDGVSVQWLADLLKLIHSTPNLDWLLLSKRPENWKAWLEQCLDANAWAEDEDGVEWLGDWIDNIQQPKNVWIGTTVENQDMADQRIPELLKIPAKVRFLSCEPLLGPIDLGVIPNVYNLAEGQSQIHSLKRFAWECSGIDYCDTCGIAEGIDWVIVGGESGPKARPCNVEWIRSIVNQCKDASVPVFVKQLGTQSFKYNDNDQDGTRYKFHTFHPKGGDPAEWPEDLRVQQFPNV